MATLDKIRAAIAEIAQHPSNVTETELVWVVEQLKQHGFSVRKPRKTRHGDLYGINSVRFRICSHNPGSKQVKAC
jgi:hypothetical protein